MWASEENDKKLKFDSRLEVQISTRLRVGMTLQEAYSVAISARYTSSDWGDSP